MIHKSGETIHDTFPDLTTMNQITKKQEDK